MHNIDSALEAALIALSKMASSKWDSLELLLRKLIRVGCCRHCTINGEQSGRIKLIYVFNQVRVEKNPRSISTLNILFWKENPFQWLLELLNI